MAIHDAGAHGWAEGCELCRFGVVVGHKNNTVVPLYLATMFAVAQHLVKFCTCRAGRQAQAHNARVQADYDSGKEVIPPQWREALDIDNAPVPTVTYYRNIQPVEEVG